MTLASNGDSVVSQCRQSWRSHLFLLQVQAYPRLHLSSRLPGPDRLKFLSAILGHVLETWDNVILLKTYGNGVMGTFADKSSGSILDLVSRWRVIIGILC
jgi:hypothetical protein